MFFIFCILKNRPVHPSLSNKNPPKKQLQITILTPEEALILHKIPEAEAKWKADEEMLKEKREKERERERGKVASASASAAGSGSAWGSVAPAPVNEQRRRM